QKGHASCLTKPSSMQSFTCRKTALVRCGSLSISRILLIGSLALSTFLTRMEAATLCASPCTLAWNSSTDYSVAGYALYYGITSSGATNRLNVGMTNMVIIYNLLASSNYFFCVVSYGATGTESLPSAAVNYRPCALSGLTMTKLAGAGMNLQFQAAPGSACHVEYTPTLNPPQWQTLNCGTTDANGNITICDSSPGSQPVRFYRAVLP